MDAQFTLERGRAYSLIVMATGLVAAGRTEALASLRDWLDPKNLSTRAWGKRDDAERARPWAWRYWQAMPRQGETAIWFDGWYGDLFHLAFDKAKPAVIDQRAQEIVALERMVGEDGVRILKWHFDIDADTQRRRVKKLTADDLNRWRISENDRRNCRRYPRVVRAHALIQSLTDHPRARWTNYSDAYKGRQAAPLARQLLATMTTRPPPTVAERWQPPPGRAARLRTLANSGGVPGANDEQVLLEHQSRFAHAIQSKRWKKRSLVIVLEGMDAAGKSSATKRVIATLDPRQYQIVPTRAPSADEAAHPYLWRFWKNLPARSHISIFDRSWYGRVLVERVRGFASDADWRRAYAEIVEFERCLTEHRIVVAKFWFAMSKQEQARRFQQRKAAPLKRFKVDPEDLENRRHWDEFQTAAADMVSLTDSRHAPWTLIPADDKAHARAALLHGLCKALGCAND